MLTNLPAVYYISYSSISVRYVHFLYDVMTCVGGAPCDDQMTIRTWCVSGTRVIRSWDERGETDMRERVYCYRHCLIRPLIGLYTLHTPLIGWQRVIHTPGEELVTSIVMLSALVTSWWRGDEECQQLGGELSKWILPSDFAAFASTNYSAKNSFSWV